MGSVLAFAVFVAGSIVVAFAIGAIVFAVRWVLGVIGL